MSLGEQLCCAPIDDKYRCTLPVGHDGGHSVVIFGPMGTTGCMHRWVGDGRRIYCSFCGTDSKDGEWLIPRCPHGCGLARHKGSCAEAAATLGAVRAMLEAAKEQP